MSTILWNGIIFGPIHSRRLGTSLGVNLMPSTGKVCNFDCIYCECGWNKDGHTSEQLPSYKSVCDEMETKLMEMHSNEVKIDTITFSGNGEPTLHPDFPGIIDFTLKLRDKLYPDAKVSVLSNATNIHIVRIREALLKVDNPILKIDSGDDRLISLINRPHKNYSKNQVIDNLKKFKGRFILQTMFLKGNVDGHNIDSTDPLMVRTWLEMVIDLNPREVMVYTIDRETPAKGLNKVTVDEMEKIVEPLRHKGIPVQVRG